MQAKCYEAWLRVARRHSRRPDEAEDLLQDALLAAVRAERHPLTDPEDGAWFRGVLERRARMRARTAVRERARTEGLLAQEAAEDISCDTSLPDAIDALPAALRRVLVLALNGLDRTEIRQVLGISDAALRQRLTALRRQLPGVLPDADPDALAAAYAARRLKRSTDAGIRRAALAGGPLKVGGFRFGIADDDGNLFAIGTASQNGLPRQQEDEPGNDPESPSDEKGD